MSRGSTARRLDRALVIGLVVLGGCGGRASFAQRWNELRGDPYVLDGRSRDVDDPRQAVCPEDLEYVRYSGERIGYQRPILVARPFLTPLGQFERVLADVATAHYGRAPRSVLHFGARACRTVRGRSDRLSEHALGNALDVSGFSFAPISKGESLPPGVPERLRRRFTVSIRRHWSAPERSDDAAHRVAGVHAAFLSQLVQRLQDADVFRGYVGPSRRGHAGHLHFDYSPWPYSRL